MKLTNFIENSINFFVKRTLIGNVIGSKNLITSKDSIFIANHSSYLDHFIMIYLFKKYNPNKDLFFLTKKEAFDHFLSRKWHESLNAIPIDRTGNDSLALQKLKDILDKKMGSVVIYPEGTRTSTGFIGDPKLGAAFLSMVSHSPIIPLSFNGLFDVLPKYTRLPKFKKIDVTVGEPITFSKENKKNLKKDFSNIWNDNVVRNSNEYYNKKINLLEAAHFYNEKGIRNYPDNLKKPNILHKRAIYICKQLINKNTNSKEAYFEMSRSFGRLGANTNNKLLKKHYYHLANKYASKSLKYDNNFGPAFYVKATLNLWNENPEKAIEGYKKALKLMPNQIYVEIALGKALKKYGYYSDAKRIFQKIIKQKSDNQVDIRRKHEAEALLMRLDENIVV